MRLALAQKHKLAMLARLDLAIALCDDVDELRGLWREALPDWADEDTIWKQELENRFINRKQALEGKRLYEK